MQSLWQLPVAGGERQDRETLPKEGPTSSDSSWSLGGRHRVGTRLVCIEASANTAQWKELGLGAD